MAPPSPPPGRPPAIVGVMRGVGEVITEADDAFLAMVGYSRADFAAGRMNWAAMTPPEYLHLDAAGIRQAAESGGFTVPYRKEFVRQDGTRVPVLLVCAFIPGTRGAWMGYVVDLSPPESRRPEAADAHAPLGGEPLPREFYDRLVAQLVAERTRTQAMLDGADALIWAVDAQFHLLAANAAFQRAQVAVRGRPFAVGESVQAAEYGDAVLEQWRAVYGRVMAGERVALDSEAGIGDETRHFEAVISPMLDARREVAGATGVARDVTAQRRAEAALRASETRFRALAAASPLGVFQVDRDGVLLYANPRVREIWRIPEPEEFASARVFGAVHPDDRARAYAAWERALATGVGAEQEFRLRLADGAERHLRAQMAPLREGERVTGFVGTVDDDTERHALEQRVRQTERMESLGTLAGGIAHDFNNMLGVVLGHTEVALAESAALAGASAELRESLEEVRTASLRARDLVRQILTFSRRTEQGRAPVDLRALTVESMRLLRPMLPANVRLELALPDHAVTVLGDASALQQVLVNLVTNAEHAMRATGGGLLSVSLEARRDGAPRARLAVRDTGSGIAPAARARLFDPFFTTKPTGEGTGMGLAVAHGVVTSHGGSIAVEEPPGRGAAFVVTLPLAPGAPAPAPEAAPAPRGQGRVVLVEDEPALARFATQALTRAGYDVTCVHDGESALRLFDDAARAVDVVVSDVTMPGMSGDRLARELRRLRPTLPVILTTGFSHLITPESVHELGVAALLQKPFGARELVAAVRTALDAAPGAPPTAT
ncbi:PAS domain S-box protein [Roseisolibacter sp. H3M3-2]|uniref:PAS domain S-box protein n=1 Tax=Roseisolibacter sp. H3M3-2 TaxID=3031323 RepID=UPI0023DC5D9B|nr:PAS domain S-box protein [Roseisolibacter sp. H3M3-2]MDF1501638.1 PAS domain S-box protein [Roseisolibacter sp. H3M3-2]